jgi:hypothetical protein
LKCICSTIECNDEPEVQRFTNYNNYYSLSTEEEQELFVLCYTFSPDVFDDQVLFQSDALCMDDGNQFYEISQVSTHLMAASSIVIAGRTRRVNKIMTYKMSWMQTYYLEPMRRQAQRFNKKKHSRCVIS